MATVTEIERSSPSRESTSRVAGRRVALTLGILLLLASLLAGYAQVVVISNSGFADHVTATLDDPGVRGALSTVLVGRLLKGAPLKVRATEPILQDVVGTVIGSSAFKNVFRRSLTRTHSVLLSPRNSKIVVNLSSNASLILGVLAARYPQLANNKRFQTLSTRLANISQGNALLPLIQTLHRIRMIEILAPIGAVLCFVLYLVLAADRRRGLRNVGFSAAALAFVVWLALALGQWLSPYLVSAPLSQALPGIWQAMLGDLRRWSLVLVVAGLIVAAIANTAGEPPDMRTMGARVRLWTGSARSGGWRAAVAGVAAVVLGLLLVFEPSAFFRLLVFVAGAAVVYWGVYTALGLLSGGTTNLSRTSPDGLSAGIVGAGRWSAVGVVMAALILLWIRNVWTI